LPLPEKNYEYPLTQASALPIKFPKNNNKYKSIALIASKTIIDVKIIIITVSVDQNFRLFFLLCFFTFTAKYTDKIENKTGKAGI